MNIIGYTDQLSYRPGDVVRGRLSTTAESFTARLVRLINGDSHPAGPGVDIRDVASDLDGTSYAGRVQPIRAGSCLEVAESSLGGREIELDTWVRPTLVPCPHDRTVVSLVHRGATAVRLEITAERVVLGDACECCHRRRRGPAGQVVPALPPREPRWRGDRRSAHGRPTARRAPDQGRCARGSWHARPRPGCPS